MTYYPDFAQLLDEYLVLRDRSGAWLAQRLGVNPATVSRWRSGNSRPNSPELVEQIADVLHIVGTPRRQLLYNAGYSILQASETTSSIESEADAGRPAEDLYATPAQFWQTYPTTYRQDEMNVLAQWLRIGASGLILGLAGSGVSSLLRYLAYRPQTLASYVGVQKTVIPVWIEVQPATEATPVTIYRTLLQGILETANLTPRYFAPSLLENCRTELQSTDSFTLQRALFAVLTHFQTLNATMILVFDRIDQLSTTSQRNIGNTLRALRDRYSEVTACFMGMRMTPNFAEQLYTLGDLGRVLSTHTCIVSGYNERDSYFSIEQWTHAAGTQPDESDIEQFLLLSGGYPTLLKAVSRWWAMQRDRPRYAEWQAILLHEIGVQLRLREIRECLSLEEHTAIKAIIAEPGTNKISPVIGERLVKIGVCRRRREGWYLAGTLFNGLG